MEGAAGVEGVWGEGPQAWRGEAGYYTREIIPAAGVDRQVDCGEIVRVFAG